MREYKLEYIEGLPTVPVLIVGPKSPVKVNLIFDTGCYLTQIDIPVLNRVGFSFLDREPDFIIKGVTGEEPAYSQIVSKLSVFGTSLTDVNIAAISFTEWAQRGVVGLLDIDVIEQFAFKFIGPEKKDNFY